MISINPRFVMFKEDIWQTLYLGKFVEYLISN